MSVVERRESDRSLAERIAVIETQYLNLSIILNGIKTDVHEIAKNLSVSDSALEHRVSIIEKNEVEAKARELPNSIKEMEFEIKELKEEVKRHKESLVFMKGAWWTVNIIFGAIIYLQHNGIKIF